MYHIKAVILQRFHYNSPVVEESWLRLLPLCVALLPERHLRSSRWSPLWVAGKLPLYPLHSFRISSPIKCHILTSALLIFSPKIKTFSCDSYWMSVWPVYVCLRILPPRVPLSRSFMFTKKNNPTTTTTTHQHGRWGHLNSAFNNLQRRCWRDSACETLRSTRDSGWWTASSLGDLKGSVFTPAHAKTAAEVIPLQVLPHFPAGWRRLLLVPDSKRRNDTRRRGNMGINPSPDSGKPLSNFTAFFFNWTLNGSRLSFILL